MPVRLPFGYYPEPRELRAGDIAITSMPTLAASIEVIARSPSVHDGWLYAPPQERRNFMTGEIIELPYPARVFGLAHTHVLEHATAKRRDRGRVEFLVDCLGFFVGMHLTHFEAGYLDATPITPGKMTDIVWLGDSLGKALLKADAFWLSHAPEQVAALRGAIQSFHLAQNPRLLEFESFIYLYTAIDSIYFVKKEWQARSVKKPVLAPSPQTTPRKKKEDRSHAGRIKRLCRALRIPIPTWARAGSRANIFDIRNRTLHEGLFSDEPFGLQDIEGYVQKKLTRVSKVRRRRPMNAAGAVLLGMTGLISRLVIALLGMRPDYIKTSVHGRQRYGVRL